MKTIAIMPQTRSPAAVEIQAQLSALRQRAADLRSTPWQLRRDKLKALRSTFVARRNLLRQALATDLGRPNAETDIIEYMPVITELDDAVRHVRRWATPQRVATPIWLLGARSEVRPQPKGVCLIIAPWNYPVSLLLGPLVSCIAAGNTAVLKPSEFTPSVSSYVRELLGTIFAEDEVLVVEGGREVSERLLEQRFDHIFFTGSPRVGSLVMAAAAKAPTSVTLELGGKSPAIVHRSADIADAARKIVWGKFVNAGQTCIAPDYVLTEESVSAELTAALVQRVRAVYPIETVEAGRGNSFSAIVSEPHAERLLDLIEDARAKGAHVLVGGTGDAKARFIAPTILAEITSEMRIDQEEIFGPLLPIRVMPDLDAAIAHVNAGPSPLASYVFARDRHAAERVLTEAPAGGSCVNNVLLQFANTNLPFGGIGPSGIGRSHSRAGFEAFSNMRGVVTDRFAQTQLFFPPYTPALRRRLAAFLRLWGA